MPGDQGATDGDARAVIACHSRPPLRCVACSYNPVGFYQISKIAITPVVVLMEWVVYKKTVSHKVRASPAAGPSPQLTMHGTGPR